MARNRQASRDEVIHKYLNDAPGSITARELAGLANMAGEAMPRSAVLDSIRRLKAAGHAFASGERRGRRYGSTQAKADTRS
jgi:hypothetical protein